MTAAARTRPASHRGIPHMHAGSFASALHGTPRTTQDIDLVSTPTPESLAMLVAMLSPDEFYEPAVAPGWSRAFPSLVPTTAIRVLLAAPTIASFSPPSGRVGAIITVTGTRSAPTSHLRYRVGCRLRGEFLTV